LTDPMEQAQELMLWGNFNDAQEIFLDLLKDDPENDGVLYHLGLCNFSFEYFEDAATYFGRCLEVNPRHLDAWVDLGEVYIAMDEPEQSKSCFEQALALDSDNPRAVVSYARFFDYTDQFAEAVFWYEKAMSLCDPIDAPRFELAVVYSRVGRYLEADLLLEGLITESLRRGTQYFIGDWQAGSREDLAGFIQEMREEREEIARLFAEVNHFPIEQARTMYQALHMLMEMDMHAQSEVVREILALKLVGLDRADRRSHFKLTCLNGNYSGEFLHSLHVCIAIELHLNEALAADLLPAFREARKLFNP
jgi:tetratricopeptide (TPR) repeat protein